jgi:hypothetical protein
LGHIGIQLDKSEEIAIKSIDEFSGENNIDHIYLLKIGVEGHEISVFSGTAHMLKARAIDFIQFEFGGCIIDSRTYFRDFFLLLEKTKSFTELPGRGYIGWKDIRICKRHLLLPTTWLKRGRANSPFIQQTILISLKKIYAGHQDIYP